ncbi:MAG: hypothetical protein N2117_12810 [Anaerolineales bacterium]|nr:hypothetical protein [Anaerolineales bacterium]
MSLLPIVLLLCLFPAQPGVLVQWVEYRKQGQVWEMYAGPSCWTDEQGQCRIEARAYAWPDGLVRGYLDLGALGVRPLIWPGGELRVSAQLNEAGRVVSALETKYDHLPIAAEAAPVTKNGGAPGWVRWLSLLAGVFFLSFGFAAGWGRRR